MDIEIRYIDSRRKKEGERMLMADYIDESWSKQGLVISP